MRLKSLWAALHVVALMYIGSVKDSVVFRLPAVDGRDFVGSLPDRFLSLMPYVSTSSISDYLSTECTVNSAVDLPLQIVKACHCRS